MSGTEVEARAEEILVEWAARGTRTTVGADDVFVIDREATGPATGPPLLVLHGFPTSSIDFAAVLDELAAGRRVVLVDLPGYGRSSKPDRPYSLFGQADVVEAVVAGLGLDEVDLLTHDMGDSVGGELLARSLDGDLGFAVRRRVLTNGSIYLDLAHLTDGQTFLAALPDQRLADGDAADLETLVAALTATLAPDGNPESQPDPAHVLAAARAIVEGDGHTLLPRLIRYIDERRQHEGRWTGAVERHPAPLTIVWGELDPIAVWVMTDRLLRRRADAVRHRLAGVGHYPMVETPAAFSEAVLAGL
jgi:pimeloyl-ACP methyl ester carboxylesterase